MGTNINSLIIITPQGYRDIMDKFENELDIKSIYLKSNDKTIKKRLLKRGDNKDEAQRRLEHDNKDFEGIEKEVDYVIENNYDDEFSDVVYNVLDVIVKEMCNKMNKINK